MAETGGAEGRFRIEVPGHGPVSARFDEPGQGAGSGARVRVLLLAHGAGAGMEHDFMAAVTSRLVARGLGVVRYNFPYTESGRGWPPDRAPVLEATVRAAVEATGRLVPDARLFAGGKSLGGRMTSRVAAADGWTRGDPVQGLVFVGFPLHTRTNPGTDRARHLADVDVPMLFLQGTRDALADLDLLGPVTESLGGRAELQVVDMADHAFHVPKRSGRTDEEVLDELADSIACWTDRGADETMRA